MAMLLSFTKHWLCENAAAKMSRVTCDCVLTVIMIIIITIDGDDGDDPSVN
jgi:hypothetical protein